MPGLDEVINRLEQIDVLDGAAERVSAAVGQITHRPPLSSLLSGTWLGHPLHPVLTDLPIGSWTSAFVLDLIGGKAGRRPAQTLIGLGVLAAVPTALTGLADWSDTVGGTRRVGSFHAVANTVGLACYALSWRARRRGHHGRGVLLAMAGATAATAAAGLGGHLVYRTGTGVDVNAFDEGPADWTTADTTSALEGADGLFAEVGSAGVLALRDGPGGWHGIGARCSHRGGPLQEGTFADGCVTCPWHQSRFRLDDGTVVDGPATSPQPRYEVRETDGVLSIRR
jgi:nitrite reductase/ring-hydroxylating ferredoxin subunit/uncharacterized membrane protein